MTFASTWQDYSLVSQPAGALPTFRKAFLRVQDHFIPHERNNYHPHILGHQLLGLLSLLMVVVKLSVIGALAFSPVNTTYSSAITVNNILSLTNNSRGAYQAGPLSLNSKLGLAAQNKANDMAAKGYFSHTTPDGKSPWSFIQATGYSYITAGENLAVDFTQAENVDAAWMNSPGHRANILNKDFTEIGIGIASGQFQGHSTTFVVQMFGAPVAQAVTLQDQPTPVAPKTETPPAPAPTPAAPVSQPAPAQVPAASPPVTVESPTTPAPLPPPGPVSVVDTSTAINGDQLVVNVTTAGPAVKVLADYNGGAAMLYPRSDTSWETIIPLSSLQGDVNLTVTAFDMQGKSQQAGVLSFSPSPQSNYQFLGDVRGEAINILGSTINPKVWEQKFYLIMIAGLLVCLILAIAIKRHVQHLSLVANGSFVVVLATLLWMAG